MWQVQLVLAVFAASLVESSVPWNDPCYLRQQIKQTPNTPLDSKQYEVQVPPTCNKGTVIWDYPEGTLRVKLTRAGPYSFCLEGTWATFMKGFKKVVDGVETDLPLLVEGGKACSDDCDGKTEFIIYAKTERFFQTNFDFSVAPRKTA